jgi:hypothetical protein
MGCVQDDVIEGWKKAHHVGEQNARHGKTRHVISVIKGQKYPNHMHTMGPKLVR